MLHKKILSTFILIFGIIAGSFGAMLEVHYNDHSKMLEIALDKLKNQNSFTAHPLNENSFKSGREFKFLLFNVQKDAAILQQNKIQTDKLGTESYQIIKRNNSIYLVGGDEKGLMYGILDIRDHLKLGGKVNTLESKLENPHFPFRAIKFNLPWSSYRQGESLQLHMETVKDTVFWVDFLDMMVDNRFNALTLWNLHPFTFMIQPKNFPEANQFTGQEFANWQKFWHTLFRMAKDRGIETYILNWNIITSPGMTAAHNVANYKDDLEWHYGFTPADTSKIIVDYMRECITQTINEYPDLTGIGVSVGERMKMPIKDAMEWIKQTYVEGIKQANRKVKFIHRAPFSVSPEEAREYIESYSDIENLEYPIIMEFKFNWSHGHSSPDLSITHGGKVADQYWNPKPKNYRMAWMMRNEDFIMLNWGNTNFIREHIRVNDIKDVTYGYFVGSETYIPAKEYRMSPETDYNWKYAFEKQWEFYQMWGRLLYNPDLPDAWFINQFNHRYGSKAGATLFETLQLASEMPLQFASFYQGTWDFTLYCEGFLNGGLLYRNYQESAEAFISIKEMISHPVLDKRYLNVDTYVTQKLKGETFGTQQITPPMIADKMQENGTRILELCEMLEKLEGVNANNFRIELNDLKSWAYLSLYFSEKLNGAVLLDEAIKTKNTSLKNDCVAHLEKAAAYWRYLMNSTEQYQEVSLLHVKTTKFHWKNFYSKVLKDIEIAKDCLSDL